MVEQWWQWYCIATMDVCKVSICFEVLVGGEGFGLDLVAEFISPKKCTVSVL